MACGVPIVTTDVDDAYIIKEAECGIISNDKSSFANALITFIDQLVYRSNLAANRESFAGHYTWESIAIRYEQEVFKTIHEKAARQSISAS